MNKILIVANWKCNPPTLRQARQLFGSVKKGLSNSKNKKVEVVICPPFPFILNIKSEILNLKLGAQNCFWEKRGAFTGEVSPQMLKDLGCQYVILGHSERRRYFGETDEQINKKVKAALSANLKPILCMGENQEQRSQGKTKELLEEQLISALKLDLKLKTKILNLAVAYEPLWAIGTGRACPPKEVQSVNLLLRKILSRKFGAEKAEKIRILYGGSVNSKNAVPYIKEAGSQGLLIGGASLKAKEFLAVIRKLNR